MTEKKVWLITGAGRDTDTVANAVGEADDLLVVKLDITSRADAEAVVQAAVERFGRIDVLVNNAANFYAGYFEELARADRAAAGDEPARPDERHPRRPARHAQAALGPHHLDLVGRGPRRP